VSLSFVADEALTASPVASLTGIGGCDPIVDTSSPNRTNWNTDCRITTSDAQGIVAYSIDYIDDYGNNGVTVTATTDASEVEIKLFGVGSGGGSGVQ